MISHLQNGKRGHFLTPQKLIFYFLSVLASGSPSEDENEKTVDKYNYIVKMKTGIYGFYGAEF